MDDGNISPDFAGQYLSKTFTIAVTLAFLPNIRWNERLDNPLGLKVVGYVVEDGGNDPLNPLGISETR
jgi:type IV secretory pathway component VirB8